VIPALLIVWVDLEQAIVATDEGRRIKAQLAAEHQKATAAIRAREEKLRAIADPMSYDREAAKLAEEAAKSEEALELRQEELLAPIIARMEKIIAEHRVIDLSEQPLVDPPKSCDATAWLVRAYAKAEPLKVKPCEVAKAAYVDFDRALALSAAGKAATKGLDAFKEKAQAELDGRQRQMVEIERRADRRQYEEERREVAQLYARHQREIEARAMEAEEQLYATLRKKLRASAQQGLLFIEAIEDQRRLEPNCDASEWAAKLMDGKAAAADLRQVCAEPS
jgi:Skp family chaperone for outer membrane proteins